MNFKDLIRSAHPYLDLFDYDHYPDCFARFEKDAGPFFLELQTDGTENGLEERVQKAMELLTEDYGTLPRREMKEISFRDKQVLALFLTPAALREGGSAEKFARALCSLWVSRYSRNRYLPGNYESIMKGFDANLLGLPLRKSKKRR